MRLVIVTGMSGAGKTAALKMLEDMGFYCVDNLPIPLVGKFAELVQSSSGEVSCAALGIDVRSGDELAQLEGTLNDWNNIQFPYEILFLDLIADSVDAHPLQNILQVRERLAAPDIDSDCHFLDFSGSTVGGKLCKFFNQRDRKVIDAEIFRVLQHFQRCTFSRTGHAGHNYKTHVFSPLVDNENQNSPRNWISGSSCTPNCSFTFAWI